MKKAIIIASALLLIGAGCPAKPAPSAPAAPPAAGAPAPGTKPATPPTPTAPPVSVPNPGGISPENPEDRVVVFTPDAKFDPPSIAVHVGRTVTWINQSRQNAWPASNPHPVHTDCPGFDAKSPIPPGKSWSFTFTEAKVCNYHNHLQTGTTGIVTVTPVGK